MFTSCTSIEQTLLKQIVTGDEVLALVHLFLLKKLLCICTVGFCDQASSWSSLCGSLPERFHAKITAIEESKDIDKIHLTELVGNLQIYELELSRIGKSGKGKSMALKAKSSDTDESSDDEDSKMKS